MAKYYEVIVSVSGYYSKEVLAENAEDAVDDVIEMFNCADFGVLEDIDGNVCNVSESVWLNRLDNENLI